MTLGVRLLEMMPLHLAVLSALVVGSQSQSSTGPSTISNPNPRFSIQDMLSDGNAFEVPQASSGTGPSSQPNAGTGPGSIGSLTSPTNRPSQKVTGIAAMQSILGGISKPPGGGTASISVQSMDVVSGLIEAFMHKVRLLPGEKACLKSNAGQITGDIVSTGQDVVIAVKAMMNLQKRKDASSTAPGGNQTKTVPGQLVSAGVDAGLKLTSLVTLVTSLLKNCVHGDAVDMLKLTGKHLTNPQYLGQRFLVNGVDIARSLADSIVGFEVQDFHRFGVDIGTALRKILLSNRRRGTKALPEGVPQQDIIQKATEGVMRGFFVSGSGIEITDKADPTVDIVLSLHRCVAGNALFFKEVWTGLWDLIAQLAANGNQHGLGSMFDANSINQDGQPRWAGELMVALLQFPMAMQRCGIDAKTQRMFARALQTLNAVKVQVTLPEDRIQAMKATDRMARAVKAWTDWKFKTFGRQIGMLLRELLMLAIPKQNLIVTTGKLTNGVVGYSARTPVIVAGRQTNSAFTTVVAGCALSVLVALAAVRSIWVAHQDHSDDAPFIDMEGCS